MSAAQASCLANGHISNNKEWRQSRLTGADWFSLDHPAVTTTSPPCGEKVVIRPKKPDTEFVRGYLLNALSVQMVSKTYVGRVGDVGANPGTVGTGPYAVDVTRRDVGIRVRVNPNVASHWRYRQLAFETLTFRPAPEQATRLAVLLDGEADLAPIADGSVATATKGSLNVKSIANAWTPVIRLGGVTPRFPNPTVAWANAKVRHALSLAIDKQAIVDEIFRGQGAPAGSNHRSRDLATIEAHPDNPAKAKALLAEADYPNGFDIEIKSYVTMPGAELPTIAEAIAIF